MRLQIGDRNYTVKIANTDESRHQGLRGIGKLPRAHGLVLKFDEPTYVPISMKGMKIPLSLIFIKDGKVKDIKHAEPEQDDINIKHPVDHVLEVNLGEADDIKKGSTITWLGSKQKGGIVEYVENGVKAEDGALHILDEEGVVQANLKGNERIFSRKHTKQLIRLAAKAAVTKNPTDYRKVGRAMVAAINKQNTQEPEFIVEFDD